jgi:CubicO group peptidase (beta-lactamase class C family)
MMTTRNWQPYDTYAARLADKRRVPGAVVSVAVGGEPVYTRGFGYRDVEKKLPLGDDTIFGLGSITKSFTAVAIMQLQEQGRLTVSDPVIKYVPEFRFGKVGAEKNMTIHHFLTHTAGLPPLASYGVAARSLLRDAERAEAPGTTDEERAKAKEQLKTLVPIDDYTQLASFIAGLDMEPLWLPGEQFSYSNECFALLGLVIERVSGEKYEDYVGRHILGPLGMTHTAYNCYKSEDVATLYASKRVKGKQVVYRSPLPLEAPAMIPAGLLRSTARDILRYMDIYRTGGTCGGERVLSAGSIDQMTSPYARIPDGYAYGYGLRIHPNYRGVSLIEHGGVTKGVSAYVSCIREKGITGVALANLVTAPSADLLLGALNVLLEVPVTTRRFYYPKFDVASERLERYAGLYVSGEGALKVTPKDQKLLFEIEGRRFSSRAIGVDAFAVRMDGVETPAYFLCDRKGAPSAVEIRHRIVSKAKQQAKAG